jgi:hypothetical protein
MPGIGGIFKGLKASIAKTAEGAPKGTYVNGAGVTKAKPGFTLLDDGTTAKNEGMWAVIQRNPKRTAAAVAGVGGAYYMMG